LSPTADELDLFYVHTDRSMPTPPKVVVRHRASKSAPFASPVELPELGTLCTASQSMFLDASEDGLRLYFTCADDSPMPTTVPLRVAHRSDKSSPFMLEAMSLGMVGRSIALGADELVAYASPFAMDAPSGDLAYTRSSTTASFGAGVSLTGISAMFRTPEPSHDGLLLFGTVAMGSTSSLAVASRASVGANFSAPSMAGLPARPAGVDVDSSPAISADCRTLYFVRILAADAGREWGVYAAHR
jgi:hypothetical protein